MQQLFTRGAIAWCEASALRARTKSLQQEFAALGLLARVGRRIAEEPAVDDPAVTASLPEGLRASTSTEAYRALFQSVPIPCIHSDTRGVILEVNVAAARLLNMPASRLVGKPLLHFVARGETRPFREMVRGLGRAPERALLTVHLRPRGGRPVSRAVQVMRLGRGSFGWFFEEPPAEPTQ